MSTQEHIEQHWSKDWILSEAQTLENVNFEQAFTILGNSELYRRVNTDRGSRLLCEVISEGNYTGLTYIFPMFLIIQMYERKH